jgi:hypothetical protein
MSLRLLGASKISPPLRVHTSRLIVPGSPIRLQFIHRASTCSPPRRIQKSAISWTSIAVYLTVGASVGFAIGTYKGYTTSAQLPENLETPIQDFYDEMAVQLPPGRPGTLSPEEEAKLRELWHLLLQLTGIASPLPPVTPNGKASQSPALSRTTSESSSPMEKKKKNRLSFLKKKKKDTEDVPEPVKSVPAAESTPGSGRFCILHA